MRQRRGATGPSALLRAIDNCVVTVHLGYATPGGFHATLSEVGG